MGDQVLLSIENLPLKLVPARKLRKRYVGPFFVTRCIGLVAYELELSEAWKIHPVFHTSLLQPFQVSTWTRSQESVVEELELEENDCSYEIKKLLC